MAETNVLNPKKPNVDCWLTTNDNPYNPFTQFDEWFQFDIVYGYNTCGYISRIADLSYPFSDDMTDSEYKQNIELIVNEIVVNDILGIYKKVYDT